MSHPGNDKIIDNYLDNEGPCPNCSEDMSPEDRYACDYCNDPNKPTKDEIISWNGDF